MHTFQKQNYVHTNIICHHVALCTYCDPRNTISTISCNDCLCPHNILLPRHILFAFESLPVHMYCHAGYLARRPPNLLAREPNPQFLVNLHSDVVKGCDTSM